MVRLINWLRVIFWFIVVILTFSNRMMLAMDWMAVGMFLEACWCLAQRH